MRGSDVRSELYQRRPDTAIHFGLAHVILVLIACVQMPLINTCVDVSSSDSDLNLLVFNMCTYRSEVTAAVTPPTS